MELELNEDPELSQLQQRPLILPSKHHAIRTLNFFTAIHMSQPYTKLFSKIAAVCHICVETPHLDG
jgi:hypothetical protein